MQVSFTPQEIPVLRRAVISEMRANVSAVIAEYRKATKEGEFYCNDITRMIRHYRQAIHAAFRGESDNHVWAIQRMYYAKTGESFAILP